MTVLIRDQISALIRRAIIAAQQDRSLPEFDLPAIELARPKVAAHGDYSSNIAMATAKFAKLAPMHIATIVKEHIPATDYIGRIDLAAPGYLNISLTDRWLADQVDLIVKTGAAWADLSIGTSKRVQVEHGSANPTGPITIGSARNVTIGDTIANLLQACGYAVQREYYVNDAGSQIRHFGESIYARYAQSFGQDEPFPEDGYKGAYIKEVAEALAKEHGDKFLRLEKSTAIRELGKLALDEMVKGAVVTLARINVRYDNWFRERSLYESGLFDRMLELLRSKNLLYEKEDATWFKVSEFGGDKDAVIIRSAKIIPDPAERPTYFGSDIPYIYNKFIERKFDQVIYVWGADHHGEKPRMDAIRKVLGLEDGRLRIVIYQLINITRGGEEVRQSKRSGDFLTLDEVIDEIGADAIRFMLLTRSSDSKITLDLDLAKEQSDKNPVYYVQYAHARIASIIRKAEKDLAAMTLPAANVQLLTHPAELTLIRKMLELPPVIELAARDLAPHHLTYYAQELASTFSAFYRDCKVVDAETPALTSARLQLCQAAKITLARTLNLMGMSAPESM